MDGLDAVLGALQSIRCGAACTEEELRRFWAENT